MGWTGLDWIGLDLLSRTIVWLALDFILIGKLLVVVVFFLFLTLSVLIFYTSDAEIPLCLLFCSFLFFLSFSVRQAGYTHSFHRRLCFVVFFSFDLFPSSSSSSSSSPFILLLLHLPFSLAIRQLSEQKRYIRPSLA